MTESLVSGGIMQQLLFSPQSLCSVPLEIAAGRGHTGTVKKLLDCGASVNYQNQVIQTVCLCSNIPIL